MAKKKMAKSSIYVDREIRGFFYDYGARGSNGVRLDKIRNIVRNIFGFPFPLEERELWLRWLIEAYGISERTAKEYLKDAEILSFRIIDEIGKEWDRFNGGITKNEV